MAQKKKTDGPEYYLSTIDSWDGPFDSIEEATEAAEGLATEGEEVSVYQLIRHGFGALTVDWE